MSFHDTNRSRRLTRLWVLGGFLLFLTACEQRGVERTTAAPPAIFAMEDVFEPVSPSYRLESKYDIYYPTQVAVIDPHITPAASGSGFVFRFSWDFTAASTASSRSYLADWMVRGSEEGDSEDNSVAEKFFFESEKREFVTFKKLEAGKVYVFKVIVHVTSELDNRDLFLSHVVLKKIRVDLQGL